MTAAATETAPHAPPTPAWGRKGDAAHFPAPLRPGREAAFLARRDHPAAS